MTIVFQNVGLEWANGKSVFSHLNISLDDNVYGLVGPNGIGKSTFARLLSGELIPSSGAIFKGTDTIHFFKQDERAPQVTIAEYLLGTTAFEDAKLLSMLGDLPLDQPCSTLSGGEWGRVRLVKAASAGATFIIFDEPTNHMDEAGRKSIHLFLEQFRGGVLLISHDRELLQKVDKIIELSEHGLSLYGGTGKNTNNGEILNDKTYNASWS